MISREEAKEYKFSLDVDGYYWKDVEDMIDKVYNSIGSCRECAMLDKDTGKSFSICNCLSINISDDTFYCSYFERKTK